MLPKSYYAISLILLPLFSNSQTLIYAIKRSDTITVGADSRMLMEVVDNITGAIRSIPTIQCKIRSVGSLYYAIGGDGEEKLYTVVKKALGGKNSINNLSIHCDSTVMSYYKN